jgi:hypothetical protein
VTPTLSPLWPGELDIHVLFSSHVQVDGFSRGSPAAPGMTRWRVIARNGLYYAANVVRALVVDKG